MIAIVESRADEVSGRVCAALREAAAWDRRTDDSLPDADGGGVVHRTDGFEMRSFDDRHLDLSRAADPFPDPDLVVFPSRHAGETGPLLTAHFTGNFGPAEYGGEDGRLAAACPNALSAVLDALRDRAPPGYDVGGECTHHGPSDVGAPSMFVELGSGPDQWSDDEGVRAVARSILALRGVDPHRERTLVGFGGGHYVPRFDRVRAETDWAVGHVAADWALDAMGDPEASRDVLRQAFEQSGAEHALVDGDRKAVEAAVADLGYRTVSETWVRETDGVALDLVERVESGLSTVDEGLRFGEAPPGDGGAFAVVSLPAALVAEAVGVDRDAARSAVASNVVAFETEQNGTVPAGDAAVATAAGRDAVVDALAAVLERRYDAVERREDAVVAEETAFDPDLAAEAGVPEGPKFGALADGEAVAVDGRRVDPASVHRRRTRRFPLDGDGGE